jgi:peptidoglycan/xylan/chitin deacetylase (PgdA/CDA1 family)
LVDRRFDDAHHGSPKIDTLLNVPRRRLHGSGDSASPRVALTFDAEHPDRRQCPPGVAEQIREALRAVGVAATFFIQGRWATAYPELARSLAADGHLIGNHSHSHAPMTDLSDRGITDDIEQAEAMIRKIVGVDPKPWFRCPFGIGAQEARVLAALQSHGYQNVHWNVVASDWEDDCTPARLEEETVAGVLARGDGAIVLLHTWPAPTAEALPAIIARLSKAGTTFVTVDELIEPTEVVASAEVALAGRAASGAATSSRLGKSPPGCGGRSRRS